MIVRVRHSGRTGLRDGEALPRLRLRPRPRGGRRMRNLRRGQRGSIATFAAFAIVVAVAALGVLDVAHVYVARRTLQSVADLAALAAVQQMDDACQQPLDVATANAASNGFTVQPPTQTLTVTCGRWDSTGSGGGMAFMADGSPPLNAATVTVTRQVPYFFVGPARELQASATAKASVIDSFTLATTLADVNLLNGMLSSLLGTNVTLQAVSWNGIANADVKLADLAAAANVGTVAGLLQSDVTVSRFASLMANALQRSGVAATDASVLGLQALAAANASNKMQIPLGSSSSTVGVLTTGLANPESAANVSLNALQALLVAAELAQSGHQPYKINLNLANLPVASTLLPTSAALSVNVLSPPSIAVGEPGKNPDAPPTWRTYAHNAQITVQLDVGLSVAGLANVNVPLYVEVAPASAWLVSAQCAPTAAQSRSVIDVTTGLANLCLGTPPASASQIDQGICGGSAAPIASISANLLGLGGLLGGLGLGGSSLVEVDAQLSVPIANAQDTPTELVFDGSGNCVAPSPCSDVSTNVGSALGNALSSMANQVKGGTNVLSVKALGVSLDLGALVGSAIASVLSPLLSTLDTAILAPLLQLLGVQLGVASVADYPLSCGVAQLVK